MRIATFVAGFLALASAIVLYALNYDTRRLAADVAARERAADLARSDITTLKAERAYLTRPERIEPLARALGMRPIGESQIVGDRSAGARRAADAATTGSGQVR